MSRSFRLARVILGVTAACVAAGAAAGILCAVGIAVIIDGPRGLLNGAVFDAGFYMVAAIIGGLCGLILGPGAAFGFLRRVPLGRLFAETAVCAGIGGLIGFAFRINLLLDLALAACAFGGAVAHLAWRYRQGDHHARIPLPADTV
ncbi:MAG TPA: hypothetical protein VJR24_15595 [Gemmatimonadaceae bacterium]|nr:hypothetical protein [Gemmatimonadaceae bacterium]